MKWLNRHNFTYIIEEIFRNETDVRKRGMTMDQQNFEKNYMMNTLQKMAQILRAFTRDEPKLSLTDLHKKTDIGFSSLQRFVATLVHEGFLIRNEKTKLYQLGLSLFYLGKLVEQESSILTIASPILKQLCEALNESVSMSILDGDLRRCILNFESKQALTARNFVGDTSPLYAGASAKILLANLPETEQEEYLAMTSFEAITNSTTTDVATLKEELQQIRLQGFSHSRSERILGACSISVPIIGEANRLVAAITIIVPEPRFDEALLDMYKQQLFHAKQLIEQQLML